MTALVLTILVAASAVAVAVSSQLRVRNRHHGARLAAPNQHTSPQTVMISRTESVDTKLAPRVLGEIATVVGVFEKPDNKDPGPEANSRLTGRTGLLLIVLLFFEGLTIPFIHPLLSWHIFIGLAVIPPVVLKMGSTLWRFGRYYLRDPRYRAAGPPHPLLRVLGPLVVVSTVILFASGVVLWLAGPNDHLMLSLHKVSFVFWFGVLALHVLSHLLRAVKLAAADSRHSVSEGRPVRGSRMRTSALVVALSIGLIFGVLSRAVTSSWTSSPSSPHVSRTR
ncbi:MAG TPA: hypothetical protein VKR27_03975 [Acidimicrobiales bacterium]|nr:hypothetical protein [Acidimicrobiales bacterium]